nr:MAG TPA: hypothetical protein [Caudoviricetes sp.]
MQRSTFFVVVMCSFAIGLYNRYIWYGKVPSLTDIFIASLRYLKPTDLMGTLCFFK